MSGVLRPDFLCEKLHTETICKYPNNYCINDVTNNRDCTRTVVRCCGSAEDATIFARNYASVDKCRQFDEILNFYNSFSCTYACKEDNCNLDLNPLINNQDTVYIGEGRGLGL